MFCPQCGSDCGNDPNLRFCPTCGFDLQQEQQTAQYQQQPQYAAPQPEYANPQYGAPQYGAPEYGAPAQAPAAKKSLSFKIKGKEIPGIPVIAGAAGLIVIILLLAIFGNNSWFKKSTPAQKVLAAAEKTVFDTKSLKFEATVEGDKYEGVIQLGSNIQKTTAYVSIDGYRGYAITDGKFLQYSRYGVTGFDLKSASKVLKGGAKTYINDLKEKAADAGDDSLFKNPQTPVKDMSKLVKKLPNIVKGKKLNKSVVEDILDFYIGDYTYSHLVYMFSDGDKKVGNTRPDTKDVLKLLNGMLSNGKVKKTISSSKNGNVYTLKVDVGDFAEAVENYLAKNGSFKKLCKGMGATVDDVLDEMELDDLARSNSTIKIKATIEKGRLVKLEISSGSYDMVTLKITNVNNATVKKSDLESVTDLLDANDDYFYDDFNDYLDRMF